MSKKNDIRSILSAYIPHLFLFHGTDSATAKKLVAGNVSISSSGGELGKGFYLGTEVYAAKAWALHKYQDKKAPVVVFQFEKRQYYSLDIRDLSLGDALDHRSKMRRNSTQRTFVFGHDVVRSPIVGKESLYNVNQHKLESTTSEALANSGSTKREVI